MKRDRAAAGRKTCSAARPDASGKDLNDIFPSGNYYDSERAKVAKVVIFGLEDFSSLAHFYLGHDSKHEVVAFTVHEAYMPPNPAFEGLPVIPFHDLQRLCPPDSFQLFAPMSHRGMNRRRAAVYEQGKAKGYNFISYVSSKATVFADLTVGENCFVLEDNTIQPYVRIGNNVILWSGNHIGHHSVIEDHVFFTAHVVLSGHCHVERFCALGVNSTIRDGTRIAEGTFVGMAACVTRDITTGWGIYTGVPARRSGSSSELDS